MADTAEQLRTLYARRATIVTAGRVAEAAILRGDRGARVEADKLFEQLKLTDLRINRLEAGDDTRH